MAIYFFTVCDPSCTVLSPIVVGNVSMVPNWSSIPGDGF